MRPYPSEIVTGIRAILAETIAPELTSEHAKSRLSEVRAVLASVDWDDAGFVLARRTATLAEALRQAEYWNSAPVPSLPSDALFADYQRYHEELAGLAVGTLDRLRTHVAQHPGDTEAQSVRSAVLSAL